MHCCQRRHTGQGRDRDVARASALLAECTIFFVNIFWVGEQVTKLVPAVFTEVDSQTGLFFFCLFPSACLRKCSVSRWESACGNAICSGHRDPEHVPSCMTVVDLLARFFVSGFLFYFLRFFRFFFLLCTFLLDFPQFISAYTYAQHLRIGIRTYVANMLNMLV